MNLAANTIFSGFFRFSACLFYWFCVTNTPHCFSAMKDLNTLSQFSFSPTPSIAKNHRLLESVRRRCSIIIFVFRSFAFVFMFSYFLSGSSNLINLSVKLMKTILHFFNSFPFGRLSIFKLFFFLPNGYYFPSRFGIAEPCSEAFHQYLLALRA